MLDVVHRERPRCTCYPLPPPCTESSLLLSPLAPPPSRSAVARPARSQRVVSVSAIAASENNTPVLPQLTMPKIKLPGAHNPQISVVMKFGGSSVRDAERMLEVAQIVCAFPDQLPCVVLSAMGKASCV